MLILRQFSKTIFFTTTLRQRTIYHSPGRKHNYNNGSIKASSQYNSLSTVAGNGRMVKFYCDLDYIRVPDTDTAICQVTGSWSKTVPACLMSGCQVCHHSMSGILCNRWCQGMSLDTRYQQASMLSNILSNASSDLIFSPQQLQTKNWASHRIICCKF